MANRHGNCIECSTLASDNSCTGLTNVVLNLVAVKLGIIVSLVESVAVILDGNVGNVGDRITVQIADFGIVTSWATEYGMTYIYKIVDTDGNIYTWKTSGGIAEETTEIVGTVKAHNEYRGTKQTELTRVRKASNK